MKGGSYHAISLALGNLTVVLHICTTGMGGTKMSYTSKEESDGENGEDTM